MIYLDNNASTVLYPEVIEVVKETLKINANAGAPHSRGREVRTLMETARESIAKMLGVKSEQVLFTSGATEANNMALMGGVEKLALVSALEHPSIMNVHPNTEIIPVNNEGIVDLKWLDKRLQGEDAGTVVISVMFASHETGVIQPIEKVAKIVAKHLQRYHLDAVQGAGKSPINFASLGISSISLTAHKIGGVQGIGALIYDPALNLKPLFRGGGQEKGQRPGTVNISGAVGFGKACDICVKTMELKNKRMNELREYLEKEITQRNQSVEVMSAGVERLAGTSRIVLPNISAEKQIMFLDLKGICVSAGAACSSGVVKKSGTLKAMGYGDSHIGSSLRIGMSWATTKEEIGVFIETYSDMVNSLT